MIHSGGGVWRKLVDNRSNPTDGYEAEIWNSPSIGSRISTFLRMVGHRTGSHVGKTRCGRKDHDGSSDVPTMQGEE